MFGRKFMSKFTIYGKRIHWRQFYDSLKLSIEVKITILPIIFNVIRKNKKLNPRKK